MRIDSVSIKRFQSLWDCDVQLGDLTVIVGPSNSGKSAFGRALRAVARNTQGNSHVAHGAKAATVSVKLDDGRAVSLERGKGASTYRIIEGGHEEVYAKSGTNVPQDVAELLASPRSEDGPDAHFTTQFDGPFLLTESGSTVARTIGALTNVSLLAEASREANRRRTEASRKSRIRREDAVVAQQELRDRFITLPARQKAATQLRELLAEVTDDMIRADRLEALAAKAESASQEYGRLVSRLDALREVEKLADTSYLDAVREKASRLKKLAAQVDEHETSRTSHHEVVGKLKVGVAKVEDRVAQILKEAGRCPTCLRST